MPRIHNPVIKVKYNVTSNKRVIMIVAEDEEDEIQWACST